MKSINRLWKALLSGAQLAPVPARDEKGSHYGRPQTPDDPVVTDTLPPRRSVGLWLGINVVIVASLLGFIGNIGGDTWEARLVAAISALLLGVSALIAVILAIAERATRQPRDRRED